MKYKHAAVAGTFDHFHAGHRFLLEQVYAESEHVALAITSDDMVKSKLLAATIEPFELRKKTIETYLHEQNWHSHTEISTLENIYGNAVDDKLLEAIYTTPDTTPNAEKINEQRLSKGHAALEIVTVPLLAGDDDEPVSSTRIRLGIINRAGRSYVKPFAAKEVFTASPQIRDELRSPIGEVIPGSETDLDKAGVVAVKKLKKDEPVLVISVGDIVTQILQKHKREPDISFVDHRSRRKDLSQIHYKVTEKHGPFKNEAGTVRSNIARIYAGIVQETIHLDDHNQIIIEGEEDLLGLPAILLAPLGSVVLYGQFEAGIVYVPVTEEIKEFCYEMLGRFE